MISIFCFLDEIFASAASISEGDGDEIFSLFFSAADKGGVFTSSNTSSCE